ncbi:L-2-amino-thiazoline-4-carboxylic acid hydrolase [Terrihabitans sp. B22-R8]|uniref:L-2-amino-thiazoline-4-carboxylic acid hydrolase n=1 Tax=Terrihabitans sp. B22-R8 TaxID=3425128 RepID=UPI00403C608A
MSNSASLTNGAVPPAPGEGELGILARRRIEAGIIRPIYQTMREELGEEIANRVLDKAIRDAAIAAGKSFAEKTPGGTSMRSFIDLQHLWTQDDALTVEVVTASDTRFDYNVHRCRYAEMYKEMGLGSIGHLLSCNRDGTFCEGYDPRIKMERTQTIMGGASHCDFRYTLDESAPSDAATQD